MTVGDGTTTRAARTTRARRAPRVSALLGLAALISVTAACGARWNDEERAFVFSGRDGTGDVSATDGEATGDLGAGDGGTTGEVGVATDGGAGGTGGTTGGAGTTGGSTGGTTGGGASGSKACAAKSSAPGVTDDTLTIGTLSTLTGPVPGLGETSQAAVRAHVAYRNATGGVCGRKIVLKAVDDGFENARYRSALVAMEPGVLGIAGGLPSGDGGGVDVLAAKNLPVVSTATADSAQAAPQLFDINPPYANVNARTAKFQYLYDQGVRTAALVYIDIAQVKTQVDQQKAQMQAVGIKIISEQAVPLSTLSYDAAARGVANSKADYVFYPAGGNLNASFARSMANSGYQPKFLEYLTAYGSNFIEVAGAAAEGAVNFIRSLPNEEKGSNPELDRFIEWMGRAAPGVSADTFAADSWAATKAFLDAVDAIPGPITREAVHTSLKTMKRYDAAGFFGPINLGDKQSLGCFIAMRVVDGKWQRLTPAKGFACT